MPAPLSHAQCGDQTIAYQEEGTGPALVLAHGLGLDHSIWDNLVPLLSTGLRVIRFDLRGHGGSAVPSGPYAMGALIRDVEILLDSLAVRDCVFIGAGLGGMVALGLAAKRLDQIRALVLANTAVKIGTKETWARQIESLRNADPKTALEASLAPHFSAGFRKTPAAAHWQTLLRTAPMDGVLGCAAAISGTDFYTPTASLRLPSLVIASGQDAIIPADMARELAELIPGAQFELIRKSGHLAMIEQPQAFADLVNGFLNSIGHR